MFAFRKHRKFLNLDLTDYVIRIVEAGTDLGTVKLCEEKILPSGLIQHGKIIDEIGFYEYMKEFVKELGVKKRQLRFNVPSSLVIMRQVDIPANLSEKKEQLNYIEGELGRSIHLPFQEPIIDIPLGETTKSIENETQPITFFAAPRKELQKYTEVFIDASLRPHLADIGILSNYRYFHHTHSASRHQVYLIMEFNLLSINLGIFERDQIEFIRYQDLDLNVISKHDEEKNQVNWSYEDEEIYVKGIIFDQVTELERIMNFYRYSLHKGDKSVTDIVLLGDNPYMEEVFEEMKSRYPDMDITLLDHQRSARDDKRMGRAYIPALGLALRGGK